MHAYICNSGSLIISHPFYVVVVNHASWGRSGRLNMAL